MRIIYSIILLLFLSSCSSQWHLKRAIEKGAELQTVTQIKHDTTWISEHHYTIDTSTYEHTIVKYVPKTKTELRFDYKRFRDSLKGSQKRFKDSLRHYRAIYSDSLRNALKTSKIENRTERKKDNRINRILWWFMIFFIFILFLYIVGRIVASKLLK